MRLKKMKMHPMCFGRKTVHLQRDKTMATKKEYLEFILEQLSSLTEITYRMMMGNISFTIEEKSQLMCAITVFL